MAQRAVRNGSSEVEVALYEEDDAGGYVRRGTTIVDGETGDLNHNPDSPFSDIVVQKLGRGQSRVVAFFRRPSARVARRVTADLVGRNITVQARPFNSPKTGPGHLLICGEQLDPTSVVITR